MVKTCVKHFYMKRVAITIVYNNFCIVNQYELYTTFILLLLGNYDLYLYNIKLESGFNCVKRPYIIEDSCTVTIQNKLDNESYSHT